MHRETLEIDTDGRGFREITADVRQIAARAGISSGLCHLFILHTSASLLVTENADPDVLRDLATFINGLVPDDDPRYVHTAEGSDDMSAHVKCALTQTSLTLPVADSRLLLGTWQGIFIWEHRVRAHTRKLVVTIMDAGKG
ncbi:MAG: secondary thiamine-phosphate synthase enzyme YjbQ [Wenzhouxiangellaceae bacterium]|nr:secondary thiamine-phosphate synthase enzyme YjbQ [Wenzhouxiangellaceae bacterium]